MNKTLLLAVLVLWGALAGAANPTPLDVDAYRARMKVYVAAGQNPQQVAKSLSNYFGRTFEAELFVREGYTEIRVVVGSGNRITFMQVIGNL